MSPKKTTMAAAFRQVVLRRRSVRKFEERAIPDKVLSEILALTQRAPSSFNLQPWTCVVVRSAGQRELLGRAMLSESNRSRVVEAPVTAVFAADLEPAKLLPKLVDMERERGRPHEALESLLLAAGFYASGGIVISALKALAA